MFNREEEQDFTLEEQQYSLKVGIQATIRELQEVTGRRVSLHESITACKEARKILNKLIKDYKK